MSDAPTSAPGSVSRLLGGLRAGDEEAVRLLWLRYFQPLVRLAARRCGDRDAEDVALDAFWGLCQQLARPTADERFPELSNRAHLWKLLACFTARRAFDQARKEGRRRRVVADEAALGEDGFEPFVGREPPAEFTAAVADLLECLPTDELRRVALARLEGCTNDEIARRLGRSASTVERKLQVVRALWRDAGGRRSMTLDDLPASLALEVDALCDDFERHWRRARRLGTAPPDRAAFLARAYPAARPALARFLDELERELRAGVAIPQVLGFVVEDEIGRGGMGVESYRARRTDDGRAVALKLIPGAEHVRWSGWLAELAGLRHPNLVPVEGTGTHDGLCYLVMPLVPGGDLKERLGELAAPRDAARLIAVVAGAVDFLHGHGILHRDLKPSNILLALLDSVEPLVCDFGLAGRLDEAGPVGTLAYMAPEQRAARPLTPAADVYSLGAVLAELLADPPPALARIVARCLNPDPAARYPSAQALAADLELYLGQS